MTDNLVAFLRARLDEYATMARSGPDLIAWLTYRRPDGSMKLTTLAAGNRDSWFANGDELAAPSTVDVVYDPERELRKVEAARKIVDLHQRVWIMPGHPQFNDAHLTREPMAICRSCEPDKQFRRERSWPCRTLRTLALPHADHPDYRDEWRP